MSGHHPWSDLTKHFNTEERKTVQTRAAEILVDSDRARSLRESRPQPSGTGRRRPRSTRHSVVSGGSFRRTASS